MKPMSSFVTSRRAFLAGAASAFAAPAIVRAQGAGSLNLYSSRHYDTDEALYGEFTRLTGIRINRIEAEADALIERLRAEGANTPADVFITVDAGRIERAKQMGLLQASASQALAGAVPAHLRDPDGHWFGFSKRARVIMVNRERVDPRSIATYEDLADPKWKGKVLIRSSNNIYNQSLTGAMLAAHGEAKTLDWCKGVVANLARSPRGGDTDQIRACAAGEGDIAVSNTYYLGNLIRANKPADQDLIRKIAVVFPNQGDRGTHVNISGGGIVKASRNVEAATKFLEYLVTPKAQAYFAQGNNEYPVVEGIEIPSAVMGFGAFREDKLNAGVFARNNADALKIMDRAGWK